jgi:hypothetical protein
MEARPEQPDLPANSPQAVDGCAPDRMSAVPSGQGISARPRPAHGPMLSLVAGSVLTLGQTSQPVPGDWQQALDRLAAWLDLDIRLIPVRPVSELRRAAAWASSIASAATVPVFAPWQAVSPVALQGGGHAFLPRASWVASYLHDQGAGKKLKAGGLDVMLMSPLPAACPVDDECSAPMPRADAMQAMLQAARQEGRSRVAIIVDSRRRNPMVRRLLIAGRPAARDDLQIEVLTIEDALCHLVRHAGRWDAIVVLPDLRSLVFAMLAETTGIRSPWPMLWHQRDFSGVSGEALDEADAVLPLNAPLLVQALALAASQAGMRQAAHRLQQGAARVWDCGIITPGRGSVAPYVTEVTDQEFIAQMCGGIAGSPRKPAPWRAIAPVQTAARPAARPALRLVSAITGQ